MRAMPIPRRPLVPALVFSLSALAAHAGPADYVLSPVVVEGERAVELRGGIARDRDGHSFWSTSGAFEAGLSAWWATEVYAVWHREPGERAGFDAWEWENRFQLTETGRLPFEAGLVLEIERPKVRAEGYELRYGPLLQTDWGAAQANLNLLWTHHVRADSAGPAELGYQWQLRWRSDPVLDAGLQGFGELGPWRHWTGRHEQSHQLGPALFGKLRPGAGPAVRWNAALLFGTGGAAPRATLRTQAENEF